ncbi:MAG TPA: iron-containing alcohol dehydrogenase [Epulopiscium sp.]|nr:iron-containing alcohol dehydrogenase [Candidatus Epulonipiscium sp.]
MQNFVFQNTTKIIFGKETELLVGAEMSNIGKKVLLHYGGGSIKKSGLYDQVIQSLKEAHVEVVELEGVKPNPRLSLVQEGIKLCKEQGVDSILAVGGGSVIDSAKSIAAGVMYDGDVWDFYTGKAEIKKALPVGVILTIPAAGSESSGATVITNEDGWYKKGAGSDFLRPQFSILNPVLTYTLPDYQTACGSVDMFAHILERYFTNVQNVELIDRMSEAVMKAIIDNAPRVLQEPTGYDARAEIMWAGTLAHNDLLGTGRIGDWASHDIEHEISGIYDIAHGAGLAIVFPAWMQYVYKQDISRFAQFANRVWNVDINPFNLEQTALEGIKRTKEFFKSLGMPVSLQDASIPVDRIPEMAKKATENGPLGQFVPLYEKDVAAILELAGGQSPKGE